MTNPTISPATEHAAALAAVRAQRATYKNVAGDGRPELAGWVPVAVAVFPCADCYLENKLNTRSERDRAAHSVPVHWTVILRRPYTDYDYVSEPFQQQHNERRYGAAATAEQALAAFADYQDRQLAEIAARAEATKAARAFGLERRWPALWGTEKQCDWAETIRAEYAKAHPEATSVFAEKRSAKWWIESSRGTGQLDAAVKAVELKISSRKPPRVSKAQREEIAEAAALAARTPAQICADEVAKFETEVSQGQPWAAYCDSIRDEVLAQLDAAELGKIEKNVGAMFQFRAVRDGKVLSVYASQGFGRPQVLSVLDDVGRHYFTITPALTAPMVEKVGGFRRVLTEISPKG